MTSASQASLKARNVGEILSLGVAWDLYYRLKSLAEGFPGGTVVESPPADAGDTGSCPSPGRSPMPQGGWAREPWPLSLRVRSLCSDRNGRGHNSERPAYRKKGKN